MGAIAQGVGGVSRALVMGSHYVPNSALVWRARRETECGGIGGSSSIGGSAAAPPCWWGRREAKKLSANRLWQKCGSQVGWMRRHGRFAYTDAFWGLVLFASLSWVGLQRCEAVQLSRTGPLPHDITCILSLDLSIAKSSRTPLLPELACIADPPVWRSNLTEDRARHTPPRTLSGLSSTEDRQRVVSRVQ